MLCKKKASVHSKGVRWVRSEGLHLTLKFLGDVEDSKVQGIADALNKAVQGIAPFQLALHGCGAFPNLRHPRIYWVGIDQPPAALVDLHSRVENCLEELGYAREGRAFTPHLTVGRVKSGEGIEAVSAQWSQETLQTRAFLIDRVNMMKSDLKPSGAEYTTLHEIKLV